MNAKFSEATTLVAFSLQLTKRQCNALLRLHQSEAAGDAESALRERLWIIGVDGLRSLDRKGLVFWRCDADGQANGFGGMTEAGRIVAALLVEAGLTVENTNGALVLSRIERAAA